MHKNLLLIPLYLALSLYSIACSAADELRKIKFEPIEMPEFYDGDGVVVPAAYIVFRESTPAERITPSLSQIKLAENILKYDLFNYWKNNDLAPKRSETKQKSSSEVFMQTFVSQMNDMKNYNRQYIGYIDKSGDTVVVVILLNFRAEYAKDQFRHWREIAYVIYAGDFFYENIRTYAVNLNQMKILPISVPSVFLGA